MKRVFVYEYLSAGGAADGDASGRDTLLPSGVAMRDAMVADLLRVPDCAVTVASGPDVAPPPGEVALAAPDPGEDAEDFVVRASEHHAHVWLVAPETGGLLERLARRIGERHTLGCAADAIALCASKRATLTRLAAHAIRTPQDFEQDPRTCRWVVKPDDGAGAVAAVRHDDRARAHEDVLRRRAAGEPVVLEPWVDGEPLSLSLLCREDGTELLSVNRQHIVVDAKGRVDFEGVTLGVMGPSDPRRARLERLARQVGDAVPGLRGFVGIDLVWHPEAGPVVIEINPRVTCAYVGLSLALGHNLAAAVMDACAPVEASDVVA